MNKSKIYLGIAIIAGIIAAGMIVLDASSISYPQDSSQGIIIPPGLTATTTPTNKRSQNPMIDEKSNGTSHTVSVGEKITLTLQSTYWQIEGSSDIYTLSQNAEPVVIPAPLGTCVPGGGCGTVSVSFTARHAGTSKITALRTSCGEALRCTHEQGSFSTTITVQ